MWEQKQPDQEQKEESTYVPAGFEKRAAAWVGIVYVLMILFIFTYSIYTGGGTLPGTFPLFLVPAAVAVIAVAIHRQKLGTAPGGIVLTVVITVICVLAAALGLLLGVPALITALSTPLGG